jgi:hypothetical protein
LYNAAFPTFCIDRRQDNKIFAVVDILTEEFRESSWKCGVAELQRKQRKQLLCCSPMMLIFRLAGYSQQQPWSFFTKRQHLKMHLVRFILRRFISAFPAAFPLHPLTAVAQTS